MGRYTKEDIIRLVEEEDVEFIRMQYTDMFGVLKNMAITAGRLEKALNNKCVIDGSSLNGLARIEESDMYLVPDLDTFTIFPWRPQQGKVARFLCDVRHTDGTPAESSPRHVLRRVLAEAKKMGYTFLVGPECEFFLFETDDNGQPTTVTHEHAGYFDLGPLDQGENARRDMVMMLEEMGFEVTSSHHEISPSQHEIDFRFNEALRAADQIVTFKLVVKTLTQRHGLYATFMPKPKMGVEGNSMHINMSLLHDGKNVFFDPDDPYGLSREAYYFMGGIMKHAPALAAITNPIVNSYKRLVPGYAAPVYIAWSAANRSPLIRIPTTTGEGMRIELRCPDPAANPYLAFAACLEAGLDGIRNQINPPKSVDQNIYSMSDQERTDCGIEALPANLWEAVCALEKDPVVLGALGDELAKKYIEAKKAEWMQYNIQVTPWEVETYLYKN